MLEKTPCSAVCPSHRQEREKGKEPRRKAGDNQSYLSNKPEAYLLKNHSGNKKVLLQILLKSSVTF